MKAGGPIALPGMGPRANPPRMIVLSFLGIILAGTIVLILPLSTVQPGCMNPIDALFTAASATCVTGLIVVDTGTFFSPFGKAVILILIQIGGLGLMTMSTFFLVLLGKRLSLRERLVLEDTMGNVRIRGLKGLLRMVVMTTLLLETAGAAILTWRFHLFHGMELKEALVKGVFHSVSGFCNAGFSLFSDNLMAFGEDWWVTGTVSGLIFLGGIGFLVLFNLINIRFWKRDRTRRGRLRLHSRLALLMSLYLFLGMFVPLLLGEWDNTLSGMPVSEKFSSTVLQALTPRTAGFNTVPVDELRPFNLWITLFMMFVGASPGGTGGGIKTVTFVVLAAAVYALVAQKKEVVIFRRTIPQKVVLESLGIAVIGVMVIFIGCAALLLTEFPNQTVVSSAGHATDLLFETVSAFGTVGLSVGLTPHLTALGKLIVASIIFLGRVGPLAVVLMIGRVAATPGGKIKYPEEMVVVG